MYPLALLHFTGVCVPRACLPKLLLLLVTVGVIVTQPLCACVLKLLYSRPVATTSFPDSNSAFNRKSAVHCTPRLTIVAATRASSFAVPRACIANILVGLLLMITVITTQPHNNHFRPLATTTFWTLKGTPLLPKPSLR